MVETIYGSIQRGLYAGQIVLGGFRLTFPLLAYGAVIGTFYFYGDSMNYYIYIEPWKLVLMQLVIAWLGGFIWFITWKATENVFKKTKDRNK